MTEKEHSDGWRLIVLHPFRLVLWANVVAATACFGISLLWTLSGYLYPYFFQILYALGLGGFLTLVAAVGFYLHRRQD